MKTRSSTRSRAISSAAWRSTSTAPTCAPISMASRCAMSSIGSADTSSAFLMTASDALDGALHDEGEKRQADEQHRQGQKHVGKGHHDPLAVGERVELF